MQNQGCRMLLIATGLLFAPLIVGVIIGAVMGSKAVALIGATLGVIIGLVLAARYLTRSTPTPPAKNAAPPQ